LALRTLGKANRSLFGYVKGTGFVLARKTWKRLELENRKPVLEVLSLDEVLDV